MSTELTQSTIAAIPDRPTHNGLGLKASMVVGDQGAYIAHNLGAPQAEINLRFTFNPSGLSGGRVVMLAGLDGQATEVLRLSYDTASSSLSVWIPSDTVLTAQVNGAIDWQCVEIGIDTVANQAKLWINGVLTDQHNGGLSDSTIQTIFFGAVHKHTYVSGDLFLDELCIADEYIGPVLVTPLQPHAGDPARWLVVYNSADPDAAPWANTYRDSHNVPFANVLGLVLPTTETIDTSQFTDLVNSIEDYLHANRLDGQVMGILLGYRVPGYVDFNGNGILEAVPALLQTNATTAGTIANVSASPASYQRLTIENLSETRMTARLDAKHVTVTDQLLARANTVTESGLGGDGSAIYFDPFAGDEPAYQQAFSTMLGWATGLRAMRTRLPIILSGDPAGDTEAGFTSVSGDGAFWGWSSTLPDPNIFTFPTGRRAVCAQLYLEGASATTLRGTTPSNWADVPIAAGYASTIVSSRDNPVSAIPDAGAFYDALREGWTLGEAWHIGQPILRSGFYLVGDPLMTVTMPKRGYEVYGPLLDLEEMNPQSPQYVLGEGQAELDLSANLPPVGVVRHYVIRRTDELGRTEAASTSARVINLGGSSSLPISLPAWPDTADWPVSMENGQVRLVAYWPDRIGTMPLNSIELLSQAYGQAIVVAATPTWHPNDRYVAVMLPIPATKTRYRWRFNSTGGSQQSTPLSDWIEPTPIPTHTLKQIGA